MNDPKVALGKSEIWYHLTSSNHYLCHPQAAGDQRPAMPQDPSKQPPAQSLNPQAHSLLAQQSPSCSFALRGWTNEQVPPLPL